VSVERCEATILHGSDVIGSGESGAKLLQGGRSGVRRSVSAMTPGKMSIKLSSYVSCFDYVELPLFARATLSARRSARWSNRVVKKSHPRMSRSKRTEGEKGPSEDVCVVQGSKSINRSKGRC